MRKNITRILFCIIFTAALILSACSGNANSSKNDSAKDSAQTSDNEVKNNTSDSETEEKVPATDFEVTLVGGDTVKLSDYLGQKSSCQFLGNLVRAMRPGNASLPAVKRGLSR